LALLLVIYGDATSRLLLTNPTSIKTLAVEVKCDGASLTGLAQLAGCRSSKQRQQRASTQGG
jgi:hypothetical protein